MAAEYFLYNTLYNNTLEARSNNSFAPLPPNTGEIFIEYFIPTNQPLYYYRENGGGIIVNDDETINDYLNGTAPPPEPDDNVTVGQVTGVTASTQIKLDNKINLITTGVTGNVPLIDSTGNLIDSGFAIANLTGGTGGGFSANFNWKFKSGTGNPSSGEFRMNNNNPNLATEIRISDETEDGADVTNFLEYLQSGDTIYAQNIETGTQFVLFNISGAPIDSGNHYRYPVTVDDAGLGSFTDGKEFSIFFLYRGVQSVAWGDIQGNIENQIDLKNALDNKLNVSGGTVTGDLKIIESLYISGTSATTQQLENSVLLGAITSDGRVVATTTPALNVSEEVTDVTGSTIVEVLSGIYYIDTSGGDATIQIPDAAPENDVSRLTIMKKSSDTNLVIITTTGGTQNIGDATSQTISGQDKALSIVSDADNNKWLITQDSRFPTGQDEGTLLRWDNTVKSWLSTTNDVTWNQAELKLTVGGNSTPPTMVVDATNDIVYLNADSITGLTSNDDLALYAAGRYAYGNSVTIERLRNNVPGLVPRALSLIDTTATIRVWRFVDDSNDPAVEFIWGTDDEPDSNNNAWWDMFLDGAPASAGTDTFAIRRRSGDLSPDTKLLTVSTGGTQIVGTMSATTKINLNTGYTNTSVKTGDLWYDGEESLFFRTSGSTYDLLGTPTGLTTVQIRRTTNYTIGTSFGNVTFDTVDVENNSEILEHDSINTERIDVKQDGLYLILFDGQVINGGAGTDAVTLEIVKNSGTTLLNGGGSTISVYADDIQQIQKLITVPLQDGDYIYPRMQAATAGLTLNAQITFSVVLLEGIKGATGAQGPQGLPGIGSEIVVTENGVNPNPTGGSYGILNFISGATLVDAGDGQTVNIITTGETVSPIKNKIQLIDSVGGQALNDVTFNPIEWGEIAFQDSDIFTFTTGNSSITVLKSGWYELSYNVNGAGGTNRSVVGVLFRNNTTTIDPTLTGSYVRNASNNDSSNTLPPFLIELSANDVLDVAAYRLGDSTAVTSKANQSFVRINYLG